MVAVVGLATSLCAAAHADERTRAVNLEYTNVPRIAADARDAFLDGPRGAGDVNGDGRPDLIAALHPPARGQADRVRVLFTQRPAGRVRLSRQPGFDVRTPRDSLSGVRYAPAGDVNADGLADVAVTHGNTVYVVFGSPSGDEVRLDSLGSRGYAIRGLEGADDVGGPVGFSAGDQNGDGVGDLAVGAPGSDPKGRDEAGSVFVLFGGRDVGGVDVNQLALLGYRIDGADAGDHLGVTGGQAGDLNGDRRTDLALSGERAQPQSADDPVWVVTGGTPGTVVDLAGPAAAYRIAGASSRNGVAVTAAGDVNGDGLGDTLVASETHSRFHLVYGSRDAGGVDVGAPSPRVVTLRDTSTNATNLYFVAGPGDVTGDGLTDMVVGGPYVGGAFVVSGARDLPPDLDLARLGGRGFQLGGALSASRIGDVDGDGRADLLLESPRGFLCDPENDAGVGSAYLAGGTALPPEILPHGRFTRGPDRLVGTGDDDMIFGDRGNDRLDGGAGDDCVRGGVDDVYEALDDFLAPRPDNDRLYGGAGRDYLDGGAGNDVMSGGPGNDRLDGGYGRDRIIGGDGNDRILPEVAEYVPGATDTIDAGRGNDHVRATDDATDRIDCGPGRDIAVVDREDRVRHCERVKRYR